MFRLSVFCLMLPALLLTACAGNQEARTEPAAAEPPPAVLAVADDDLSYRHEPLLADSSTPPTVFNDPEPGDSQRLPRSFENAPPLIPHSLEDLLPITADENACTDCHLPEDAADMGATAIPASHLYDIRRDQPLAGLAAANYNCTQCHVAQSDAAPLVESTFEPSFRTEERKQSSNLLDSLQEGVQ